MATSTQAPEQLPARPDLGTAHPPGLAAFGLVLVLLVTLGALAMDGADPPGVTAWYAAVLWSLPILLTLQGLRGVLAVARRPGPDATDDRPIGVDDVGIANERLVVVIPTIARNDTMPALRRVVDSACEELVGEFPSVRVDVVVEESCRALQDVRELAGTHGCVDVVVVPSSWTTPNGTRFKARANQYAADRRARAGEVGDDTWVLHLDDDTGVGPGTARALARFVSSRGRAGPGRLDLAQGVLAYPRELAPNRLTWLADAVRPACDLSLFAGWTGTGSPRTGLHGELLLVRSTVEADIGWDFGPHTIVEDAEFALRFAERYPGRSGWFPGCSLGASPASVTDLLRQRERWAWGLVNLVTDTRIPWRGRLPLLHNVAVWCASVLLHPLTVAAVAVLVGDRGTAPVSGVLLVLGATNGAFLVWSYWEGLRINTRVSRDPRRRWSDAVALLLALPIATLLESVGFLRGLLQVVRRTETRFTVIAKPT